MTFNDDQTGSHGSPRNRDIENPSNQNLQFKCSLCGKSYDRMASKCVPFCSIRCQQIDLGHWLNEDYGFPVESGELPDETADEG